MTAPLLPGRDIVDPQLRPSSVAETRPTVNPAPALPGRNVIDTQLTGTGQGGEGWYFPVAGPNRWSAGDFLYRRTAAQVAAGRTPIHQGIDIYAPQGTPVVAPVSGTVMSVGVGTSVGGNWVNFRGDDGITYYFAHMSDAPRVSKGQRLQPGTYIGGVGNSGNARGTSPHLHFTMKHNGSLLNPTSWLRGGRGTLVGVDPRTVMTNAGVTQAGFTGVGSGNEQLLMGGQPPRRDMQGLLTNLLDRLSNAVAGGQRQGVASMAGVPAPTLPGQVFEENEEPTQQGEL